MSQTAEAPASNLVAYEEWLQAMGRTRPTGWRWRKQLPWFKTVNIYGKKYLTREMIAEFERRAIAGELSKDIHPPLPK
jgi:hypothetical protein